MMEEDGNEEWMADKEGREMEAMAAEAKRLRKNKLLVKVGQKPLPRKAIDFDAVYGGMEEAATSKPQSEQEAKIKRIPDIPDKHKLAVAAAFKK